MVSARRVGLIVGWLLTPVVAWAVSFAGAWAGARMGVGNDATYGGLLYLAVGSLVGAIAGAVLWVVLMRWAERAIKESG